MGRQDAEFEVKKIARAAARLSTLLDALAEKAIVEPLEVTNNTFETRNGHNDVLDEDQHVLAVVRQALQVSRSQPQFGAPDLFHASAWQLVLEVLVAKLENKPIPVTTACLILGGAQTTALRRLLALERRGVVESFDDPADGRRRLLRLSARAERDARVYMASAVVKVRVNLRAPGRVPPLAQTAAGKPPCTVASANGTEVACA